MKSLTKLFRNNIQKLHKLPESIISNRKPQFVVRLMKKSNKMLRIEIKLLIAFHLQIDKQIKRANQELKQYLRIYMYISIIDKVIGQNN